jgi:hypothetical protein
MDIALGNTVDEGMYGPVVCTLGALLHLSYPVQWLKMAWRRNNARCIEYAICSVEKCKLYNKNVGKELEPQSR